MHSSGTAHDVLLPIERVCEILSRSKASIYRDIKRETFPKAQKLGRSSIRLDQEVFGTQTRSALTKAFAVSMSLRMIATMATFAGFPAARRASYFAFRSGL